MQLRLLGPLEAQIHDTPIELGPRKQRALLAMLALESGRRVSVERLIDGLWGESPPATAAKMVQLYVSHLRRLLTGNGGRIVTHGRGYQLLLTEGQVDAVLFERLLAEGANREALSLWRGEPLADVADEPFAAAEIRRLEELRMRATELAVEADLAAGRHDAVLAELDALVVQEPLRERLQMQRMLALYRAGRQSDALDAYRDARTALVDAIGVEPGPELRRLQEAILRQDPELELPGAPPPPRADPRHAEQEAERRMGAAADRAAADRAGLRAAEDELAGVLVELQVARERRERRPDDAAVVCPFKGLAVFEPEDAFYFCGRERLVAEMAARLAGSPFMGLVGPSGSGKSSALRAGLLPALAGGVLPGSERWTITLLRPGEHPLEALEAAAGERAQERRHVIAVDQFEELFTACRDAAERQAFVDALVATARDTRTRPLVLVAVRADFYGRCAAYPELWRLLAANQVAVGPMRPDELRRAIETPAARAGLEVERGLTSALVGDVEGEPGALPLLSTALLELWRRREGMRLRLADYEWAGGVHGAVARIAEDAYARLAPPDRELARALLPRLAGDGAGDALVRVRVPLDDFDAPSRQVVSALADDRLLTVGEGGVEVAHEALLREWPRLRGWLEADADDRRLRRHLRAAAAEWEAGGRDAGELYRGARLASALEWSAAHGGELAPAERDFLAAGREESQRAHRRVRLALAGMTALLALVAVGAIVALEQRGNAREQAVDAAAQRLGAEALVEDDLDRSLLLAVQGNAMNDTVQTRGNLLAAMLRTPAAVGVVHGDGQRMIGLALNPDGRTLAFLERDGTLRAIDARTRRAVAPDFEVLGLEHAADSRFTFDALAYSPDGRRLVVGGNAPAVLDARSHELVTGLELPADRWVIGVRFSPDGRTIYAVVPWMDTSLNPGTAIMRFDAASGAVLGSERQVSRRPLEQVSVLPARDGRTIVVARAHAPAEVLDARTLAPLRRLRLRAAHAALSPDDRTLVAGGDDGSVRFADMASGAIRTASGRHAAPVSGAAFGVAGRTAVTTAGDGGAIVWNVERGRPAETLSGHSGRVAGLAASRDGRTLYTAGQDGRILIWDLEGGRRFGQPFATGGDAPDGGMGADLPAVNPADDIVPFALRSDGRVLAVGRSDGMVARLDPASLRPLGAPFRAVGRGPVLSIAFAPRSGVLLVGGTRGQLAAYDAVSGRLIRRMPDSGGAVWALTVGGDGRLLASGGLDGRVRLWDLSSGRRLGAPLNYEVEGVADLSLSPDGKRLVVSHFGGVEVVSVKTGKRLVELAGSESVIDYARFTRDGRRIVGGSFEGWTQIWSADTGRPVTRRLAGHAGPITWASLSPDGRTLASSSTDGTVRLYDLDSQKPLGSPLVGVPNQPVAGEFTPDGAYLLALFADGRAIRWDVRPGSWRRHACAVAGRALTRADWEELLPDSEYAPACAG